MAVFYKMPQSGDRVTEVPAAQAKSHGRREDGKSVKFNLTPIPNIANSVTSMGQRNINELLFSLGAFGRYQKYLYCLLGFSTILWLGNTINLTDVGLADSSVYCNDTNESIKADFCDTYDTCVAVVVPEDTEFRTSADDFGVHCGRLKTVHQYVELCEIIATALGAFMGGHFGDLLGRVKLVFAAQFGITLCGTMTIAARSLSGYTIARSITAFIWGATEAVILPLAYEWTDASHRIYATVVFQFNFAYIVLSLVLYLTRYWRLFVVVCNTATAIVLVGFLLLLESPRWLVARENSIKAAETLNAISSDKWNNCDLPIILAREITYSKRDSKKFVYTAFDLFNRKVLMTTLLMFLSVTTTNVSKRALILSMGDIGGNAAAKVGILGICRLGYPSILIYLSCRNHLIRRRQFFLVSLSVLLSCYVLLGGFENAMQVGQLKTTLCTVLAVLGFCCAEGAFSMSVLLIIGESYPTVVRAIACGTFYCWGYMCEVGIIFVDETLLVLPYALSVVVGLTTLGLGAFFLKETNMHELYDTFEEI